MKAAVLATAAHDDASITLLLSFVSVNFSKKANFHDNCTTI